MSPSGTTALSATGLGKRYRRLWALRECSFDLPAGCIAALVGANGAGKTTLLGLLSGLLAPTTGQVTANGSPRLVLVPHERPLYGDFTVAEMLRFGRSMNRVWDQRRALIWLRRFDVPLDRRCRRLSTGQQAQVSLAVALGARPDVLLLDEPLASLDPLARSDVLGELLAEVAETAITVVLATHQLADIPGVADHILLLAGGRLLVHGALEEVLDRHVQRTGPPVARPPGPGEVVLAGHAERHSSFLVRLPRSTGQVPPVTDPQWASRPVTLPELVMGYLRAAGRGEHLSGKDAA